MGKILVRNKRGEEKDWVDWNGKMFEDTLKVCLKTCAPTR